MDNLTYSGTGQTDVGWDVFQQLLFGTSNLTSGPHDITITNKGFSNGTVAYLDIDYVVWESDLQDSGLKTVTYLDYPGFKYLPNDTSWWQSDDNTSSVGKLTWTDQPGAQLKLNFTGQSLALYGALEYDIGNFSCTIDGISQGAVSGSYNNNQTAQQLLCFQDGKVK